ncbi:MAG TPA: TonB-dependent receptor [Burkholderiales bacterium]|nr:TonB-dependent receptor [Burkholderiales bacterium]
MQNRFTWALLVLCVQACVGARAEEEKEAPPAVEVIGHYLTGVGSSDAASEGTVTQQRVESRPLLRPGEVVELVPGMIVTQHSGDGKANQYFLRGYNLDHGTDFALSVDGMPVNMATHAHGQGYADINFLIPELVSGIDFRKGPYFAEEGDFASAGAAHIRYLDKLPENILSLTLGTDQYKRLMAATSPSIGHGDLLIGAEATSYDGPWDVPEDIHRYSGVLRYSWGDAGGGFHVALMGYDAKWDSTDQIAQRAVDEGLIGRFGSLDPTDGGRTSRYSLSGGAQALLGSGQFAVDAYFIRYQLDLWSNFTYFLEDPVNGDQFQQSDRRNVYGLHPRFAWTNKRGGIELTNSVGLQFRFDDIDRLALYSTRARQRLSITRQDSVRESATGVYAQTAIQWTPWFRSILGARADYYTFDVSSNIAANSGDKDDHIVSPKLNLIFGPWAKTEFFVNAGYGFHSNDARGTVITVDPKTLAPVEPVDPLVRTKGAELGVRTEIVPYLQSSLALWLLKQDSELVFVGDAGTTEPSRPSKRTGVEWINTYRLNDWLMVDAELAFTHARFADRKPIGDRIPGALERTAQVGFTFDNIGRWFGGFQLRYFGPRPLIEDNSVRSDSTTLANARIGYKISKSLRVQVDVFNLFNSKDHDIDYYYASCLKNEVGLSPACPAAGGGEGINDIHFHPVEPREFRVSLVARF